MNCPDYFCQEHRECLCRENGLPEFAESTIVMFDTEEARGRIPFGVPAGSIHQVGAGQTGKSIVIEGCETFNGYIQDDSQGSNS